MNHEGHEGHEEKAAHGTIGKCRELNRLAFLRAHFFVSFVFFVVQGDMHDSR